MHRERLFSYGTLQLDAVQLATFGRLLEGADDVLPGFEQAMVLIEDAEVVATSGQAHHPILSFTGDPRHSVSGRVFCISPDELAQADRYEVAAYRRVSVTLASGQQAWVYVDARFAHPL